LKFQAVAEKTAKDSRGYFILPHPVHVRLTPDWRPTDRLNTSSCTIYTQQRGNVNQSTALTAQLRQLCRSAQPSAWYVHLLKS